MKKTRQNQNLFRPVGPALFRDQSVQGAPPLAIGRRNAQYCLK
jgi:hypothetical protein